ncbi:MAG: hypothetical protein ABIJ43_02990 [Candidatus Beckwithbacteria bacterium]|nr:YtxH domain-containing protein [Patescibacteria group bacterium]
MPKNKKSVHLASGLALGAVVAAGATFLYKTKQGKKIRKEFSKHLDDTKAYLPELIKDIKLKAKKLESSLEDSNQELQKKSKQTKKKISKVVSIVKKNVFVKSGKPMAK